MSYQMIPADSDADFGEKSRAVFYESLEAVRGLPNVILPTGNTPAPFYKALCAMPRPDSFRYLQLDEYLGLPQDDPRLFSAWLARDILDPLGIKNRIVMNSHPDSIDDEIARLRAWHDEHGPADIAVISIGLNGHVGFNEPQSSFESTLRVVDLAPSTIAANQSYWDTAVPTKAITLGIAELRRAKKTIVLLRGAEKADILTTALTGPVTEDIPASYLQNQDNVTVIADTAALGKMA